MKLNIKTHRIRKGLTLDQLSNLTGYSKGYLSMIEINKKNPTLKTLERIGIALETCPKRLINSCDHMLGCDNCIYK